MTEEKLKEYFQNSLTADQLASDLKDSQKKTGYDVKTFYIDSIKSDDQFTISKEHLIKLCNDTIEGKLTPADLNTIAFALMTSDYFHWDNKSPDGKIMETVLFDWDNPDIGFDLTIKNIALWKEYLMTGEYKLDKEELKKKFRNNSKRKNKNGL